MNLPMRALAAHFRAHLAVMMQYRGEVLLWSVWGVISPAVLYAMWSAAASGSSSGVIAGYDQASFAAYFLMMMIVGHVTAAWDVYEMGYLVRSGSMSAQLLKPVLPMWQSIGANMAYKVVTLMFVVPMWAIFAWIVKPKFQPEWWEVAAGLAAMVLGSALAYLLSYVMAMAAFWAPKLDALGEAFFALSMFAGGRFAPIEALPWYVVPVAKALPFRWMYEFPTELLVGGRLSGAETVWGLIAQLGWLGVLVVAFRVLWRAGLKRYTAVSG
ncbi:MAG TPA: ABC-2 family transporter protein [Phycisphaerae bacterium]|nr:ABC-2 family transporter protein [Phycisphaerae bacterium]